MVFLGIKQTGYLLMVCGNRKQQQQQQNLIRKSQPLKVTIPQSLPTFVILKILKYLEREETGSPQARILVQYQNLILLIFYLFLVETVTLGMLTACQREKSNQTL